MPAEDDAEKSGEKILVCARLTPENQGRAITDPDWITRQMLIQDQKGEVERSEEQRAEVSA